MTKVRVEGHYKFTKGYLEEGVPDSKVVGLAERIGADLIVAGSRGVGPLRRPIGSVSRSIAAHAQCPVLIVRSRPTGAVARGGSCVGLVQSPDALDAAMVTRGA